jgi:Tfp pilus assembly protein PilE
MTKGKKTLNPNLIELNHQDGKSDSEVMAETIHKPELLNALVLNAYSKNIQGEHFNLMKAIGVLEKTNNQIQDSDLSRAEQMLMSQAASLEQIFTNLAIRASMQTDLGWLKVLTTLALKAQNQSRCTLQALATIKNPSTTTFIKQANLANGHQQINNQLSAEKKSVLKNELLGADHDSTQMDIRTTIQTKPSYSELATLE